MYQTPFVSKSAVDHCGHRLNGCKGIGVTPRYPIAFQPERQGKYTMSPAVIETKTYIGVDVGKNKLDVSLPNDRRYETQNNERGVRRIIADARKFAAAVSFEATGPYERRLAHTCLREGIPAARLDSWSVRRYAESQGMLAKTDAIDCRLIRIYSERAVKPIWRLRDRSEAQERLTDTEHSRRNLEKARGILVAQLEWVANDRVEAGLREIIGKLDEQIAELERQSREVIAGDKRFADLFRRFQTVCGVGPAVATAVLADIPEIGELTSRSIAALVGVAPFDRKSCTIVKSSRPARGRGAVRQILFMPAMTASRTNAIWKNLYDRIRARGKPPKIAIVAIIRKMVILLNLIAKFDDFTVQAEPPKPGRRRNVSKSA